MTSMIDTNLIRIPLARALERSEPDVNGDTAMKSLGTTCTDGQVPITNMPTSGEVICGPVTSPVRMSDGVAVTLIVLSVMLLIILPISLICLKHYNVRRHQKNERHITANPALLAVPVLTTDAEWADSPITPTEEEGKQRDGMLDRATRGRGWGIFRGTR